MLTGIKLVGTGTLIRSCSLTDLSSNASLIKLALFSISFTLKAEENGFRLFTAVTVEGLGLLTTPRSCPSLYALKIMSAGFEEKVYGFSEAITPIVSASIEKSPSGLIGPLYSGPLTSTTLASGVGCSSHNADSCLLLRKSDSSDVFSSLAIVAKSMPVMSIPFICFC